MNKQNCALLFDPLRFKNHYNNGNNINSNTTSFNPAEY